VKLKLGKGFADVVPGDLDDLWTLSEVIRPGDLVRKRTTRKVKKSMGDRTEADRKPMTLQLRVERVSFHEYRSSLRVSGEIVQGPEDVRGSHSFFVDPNSRLRIYKDFSPLELDLLKEARSARPDVAFVLVDRDDAMVAHGSARHWMHAGSSKRSESEDDSQFFGDIKAVLRQLEPKYVVVAGPGFVKDRLAKELPYQTVTEGASSVGEPGLREVLSRGALDRVGVVLRESEEHRAVERIFAEIKSGLAFYGMEDAEALAVQGNVELLLVASSLLSKAVREGTYGGLRELIEKVKYGGGKVMLIGRNEDAQARLEGLGGVAGLRRWT
jgi:protein pelota